MDIAEAVRRIELAEEFSFDEAALSVVGQAAIATEEDGRRLARALFNNYWGLPKKKNHEQWAEFVMEKIQSRPDREAACMHLLRCIRESWAQIDIRLKEKFVFLLEKIIEEAIKTAENPISQFIVKGPAAEYDLPIMRAVIKSRPVFSPEEAEYLLEYLLKTADTYFTNFFIQNILPQLRKEGVSQKLAEKAYSEGSKRGRSPKMAELLYAIYECRAK
ncbi:uncharacterized protein NEMAJ01_1185 [Nematocida major]|uniref:uncharacterized protein n=1 Tax=Nematocida major TaxID=1912982 RepID=UPI0020079F40|nr:uncharacterized protein NEMAJ01_1185 [Nematocida major]KAH9386289.1 hypothetical protein NEMAJ01_1185 [Nematocida major]